MNQELALKILGQILAWGDERARQEFAWLRLIARLKYDGYRDFQAGMRFIESLATWLQQFDGQERETAYEFIRRYLVYIGPIEMQRLVEQFYPSVVRSRLVQKAASQFGIPKYRVFASEAAMQAAERLRRQTLYMGLSDGARIDVVRHSNVGFITNEQLVATTQLDKDKWQDLLKNLRDDLKDPTASFRLIYLIDDFMGTGTSFFRYDDEKKKWSGKLVRFKESLQQAVRNLKDDRILSDDWELCVHHYVASANAAALVQTRHDQAQSSLKGKNWAKEVHFSFGMTLPDDFPIDKVPGRHQDFIALTQKYYDPIIRTRHTDVGGATHLGLGYGGCALPLILEHNTPNNSIALLWAETEGGDRDGIIARSMRPLFRRRQRHV